MAVQMTDKLPQNVRDNYIYLLDVYEELKTLLWRVFVTILAVANSFQNSIKKMFSKSVNWL